MTFKKYLTKHISLFYTDKSKLTKLDCRNKELTDIDGIEIFPNLEEVNLSYNNIKDISPLKNLTKLEIINLYDNLIVDISVLKYLTHLKQLNISSNNILSFDTIRYLNNLTFLNLDFQNNILDYRYSNLSISELKKYLNAEHRKKTIEKL